MEHGGYKDNPYVCLFLLSISSEKSKYGGIILLICFGGTGVSVCRDIFNTHLVCDVSAKNHYTDCNGPGSCFSLYRL